VEGIWFVYLILAAFPGLIAFAAIYKYMEVRQASRWSSVPGKVVISTIEARSVKAANSDSNDTEIRNFAKVVYEYKVATRIYRGDRISIGEDLGDSQIAETLAKYPVGSDVTVYYNPNKREQAVIERDLPPFLWKGVTIIVVMLIAIILGAIFGFHKLGDLMAMVVRNPDRAPFVAAAVGFALLFALGVYGFQRSAARTKSWPTAPGRIISSGVRAFESSSSNEGGAGRWTTQYRAEIIYTYDIAGVCYTGDMAKTGGSVSSTSDAFAKRAVAANPVGKTIEVHYNPDNPAQSAINPRLGWIWLFWIVPAGMLALAYYVAGTN
jgi:hypothetical protein